jgi:hypothetical protein
MAALHALSRHAAKAAPSKSDSVLVVVPHVPVPDRIPEDRSIERLIRQLSKHFHVVVCADRPAPLEDSYRRTLMMEGIEVTGGALPEPALLGGQIAAGPGKAALPDQEIGGLASNAVRVQRRPEAGQERLQEPTARAAGQQPPV